MDEQETDQYETAVLRQFYPSQKIAVTGRSIYAGTVQHSDEIHAKIRRQ